MTDCDCSIKISLLSINALPNYLAYQFIHNNNKEYPINYDKLCGFIDYKMINKKQIRIHFNCLNTSNDFISINKESIENSNIAIIIYDTNDYRFYSSIYNFIELIGTMDIEKKYLICNTNNMLTQIEFDFLKRYNVNYFTVCFKNLFGLNEFLNCIIVSLIENKNQDRNNVENQIISNHIKPIKVDNIKPNISKISPRKYNIQCIIF